MIKHSKQSKQHNAYMCRRIQRIDEDQAEEGFLREGNTAQRIKDDSETVRAKGKLAPSLELKLLN